MTSHLSGYGHRNFDNLPHGLRIAVEAHVLTGGTIMSVERHSGIKSGAVTESREPNVQRQQLEDKIKAVEEISKAILENAARRKLSVT